MLNIAFVPRISGNFDKAYMARAAQAIEQQVNTDVYPAWSGHGAQPVSIHCYDQAEDAPADAIYVFIDENADAAGFHIPPSSSGGADGQPRLAYAVVPYTGDNTWSLAASHEVVELVVDPDGNLTFGGPDPDSPGTHVLYLAEVCDPCQDAMFSYCLPSFQEVPLSDFCLPAYYALAPGPILTCRKNINNAFAVMPGGYVSYAKPDPSGILPTQWTRRSVDGTGAIDVTTVDVATTLHDNPNLRGALDRATPGYRGLPLTPAHRKTMRASIKKSELSRRKVSQTRLRTIMQHVRAQTRAADERATSMDG